jgi:hypothetical protein
VISNDSQTVEGECKLDTGLDGYVVDSRLMEALNLGKDSPTVVRRDLKTLLGAAEIQYRSALTRIQLRHRPQLAATTVDVVFKDRLTVDCLVGTRFWLEHVVTFDIGNGRLIVN